MSVGRYRYSKLRWRLLVHALDTVGMALATIVRRFRPSQPIVNPERVLVIQLDHLGDAVLSTPLLAELRAAYPAATIDVLASPSNHEVFDGDPNVDRVWVAERTWFERKPDRWALLSAVLSLGRKLRGMRYDLGIDVRGDVLSVLVLALAGVRRRVGWSMGGGGFLLTDVAEWRPGRHEVRSRLALLERLGITPDPSARVEVHVPDEDRIIVARRLVEAWPRPGTAPRVGPRSTPGRGGPALAHTDPRPLRQPDAVPDDAMPDEPDWLHADRFTRRPPLLAVHLGAGNAAKRWPTRSWKSLVERFLADGWRIVVVGGVDDLALSRDLPDHDRLRDWAGSLSVAQTTAAARTRRSFHRVGLRSGRLAASAGTLSVILFSGTNQSRQWRPWSRHSLTLRLRVPSQPSHQKVCPLADHPCMSGLDPDRVYRAAMRWWSRTHRAESPHPPL